MAHNNDITSMEDALQATPPAGESPTPAAGAATGESPSPQGGETPAPQSGQKDLSLEQKKDIIRKIHNHYGNTLAPAIPEGFDLTFGDVKAIVEELQADGDLRHICQQITNNFKTWERVWEVIKDEDSWVAGKDLSPDTTDYKGYDAFQDEQRVVLLSNLMTQLHDAEDGKLEHISDVEDAIPANYQLTKAEILKVLEPGHWRDKARKQEAEKASRALEDLFDKIDHPENTPIKSSLDNDEDEDIGDAGQQEIRQVIRAIGGTNKDNYVDAIEGNLPPGERMYLSTLINILTDGRPQRPYDKRIKEEAKQALEKVLGPLQMVRGDRVFNSQDLRRPNIVDGHRRIYNDMEKPIGEIAKIIETDGTHYMQNPRIQEPLKAIKKGFKDLEQFNTENGLVTGAGSFDLHSWAGLCGAWAQLSGDSRETQRKLIQDFCEQHGLPTWYPKPEASSGHDPQSNVNLGHEPHLDDSRESRVEIRGSKAIIRVPARIPQVYSYQQGFTLSGEEIIARQESGSVMNLVLLSREGYRLAASGSVGGKLAQRSARDANVPLVLDCNAAISYLNGRLAASKTGFDFCVPYVAFGEKVLGSDRMPRAVCAVMTILDNNKDTEETQWMPRSAVQTFEGDRQLDSQLSNLVAPREDLLLNEALVHGYRRAGAKEEDIRHLIRNDGEDEKLARRLQALRFKDPPRLERIMSAAALPRLEWRRT
ncbi:hypothetical protein BJX65DRAFT_315111 [Aspergillus insuetus]